MPELDLSFALSVPVLAGQFNRAHLALVGCGGTGSWLAPAVVRTARVLKEQGVTVGVTFVDPDHVEHGNIFRQNFCDAEVGRNKAETLALRFSQAWGLEIRAVPRRFKADDLYLAEDGRHWGQHERQVTVLLGAVDNAAARQTMSQALDGHRAEFDAYGHALWWLDSGNGKTSGQVLLGSTRDPNRLAEAFVLPDRCNALPSPMLQHPELLEARLEELDPSISGLSCEAMAARNAQSLTANQMMAAIAADYLNNLLLTRELRTYATHVDLHSKSMRSKYVTPEAVLAFAAVAATRKAKKKLKANKKKR